MNAFRNNIPEKTFATLNEHGEYTCLGISPGIINKHYTPAQFQKMAEQYPLVKELKDRLKLDLDY